jgi:hypothetical protein
MCTFKDFTIYVSFKQILINLTSYMGTSASMRILYNTSLFIQRIRPSLRLLCFCHNKFILYGERLLVPCSTPRLEDNPLSFIHSCLLNIFAPTLQSWRPFLHLQPEEAPCCGDRGPPNNVLISQIIYS